MCFGSSNSQSKTLFLIESLRNIYPLFKTLGAFRDTKLNRFGANNSNIPFLIKDRINISTKKILWIDPQKLGLPPNLEFSAKHSKTFGFGMFCERGRYVFPKKMFEHTILFRLSVTNQVEFVYYKLSQTLLQ